MKNNIRKKLLSSLLALALVVWLISGIPVSAAGTITVTAPTTVNSGNLSTYQNAVLTTNGVAVPEDTFLIFDGVTATVVLENFQVKVDAPAGHVVQSGIELKNGAQVTLILRGENIAWGDLGGAGIHVPGGCKLTISAESTGSIDARGGNLYGGGTGIGASGNHYNPAYAEVSVQPVSCGDIRIEGGTVTAVGGNMEYFGTNYGSAAGIGSSWTSTGGTVTVTGGTVNATGGKNSPGIGTGTSGDMDSVTITGGTVNSYTTGTLAGGDLAAGLGSGVNTNTQVACGLKALTITGGKVYVYGRLGYSPLFNGAKPNRECTVQLREGLDLTVTDVIDPLGNMLHSTWNIRLEDLSNVQAGTGKLLVTDNAGNPIAERDIALENTATGVLTGSISELLYATRQGTSGTLTLTINGKSYEKQIVLSDSQTVTFGPGLGTAELVFVSDYLMQDISDLTLTVRDLATGVTLEDRLVAGNRVIQNTTATRGLMVLQLTPGRYSITVTTAALNGGQPITGEVTVERDGTANVEMLYETGSTTVQELVLDNGNIVFGVEDEVPFLSYFDDSKTEQKIYNYASELEYVIVQKSAEAIGNTVTVSHGNVKLKLQGVNIRANVPVTVTGGAKLRLNLAGENTLVGTGAPAIYVAAGAELTLEGSGSVNATGKNGAGIGGKNEENNGTITINSGTIIAKGDRFGPGIGTGQSATGGKITVNGGNITATGGNQAAGIGSGFGGFCEIEINGGTVNATAKEWAAGIGGAQKSKVSVTITGGTVTAQAGTRSAGIGSGYEGDTGTVTITGGTVIGKAFGEQGNEGAGIGAGSCAKEMIVTIQGGDVEGYGGDSGSGIGGGSDPVEPTKVYIQNGNVKAYGRQRYAAGIGGGGDGAVVEISGGTVYAEAWNYAAGIGGSDRKNAGTILISGGDVTVKGPAWDAAGIGSHIDTVGGNITISGGTVTVDNQKASCAPGIGGVEKITITGGTVTAQGAVDAAGIGGAEEKSSGDITITGGTVTAIAGGQGAGIGAGSQGQLGTITISGGIITAQAKNSGAGIGGGWKSTGGTILISGGTIIAQGSSGAAGIGGGYASDAMEVVITGGNIKATGGSNMPAIGAGDKATAEVTVSNGAANGAQALQRFTMTLQPAEDGEKILSAVGLPGYFGLKDVQTLDTNKLYFYLPAGTNPTQFATQDNLYNGAITGSGGYYTGHIHSWRYAASGNTITATCTAEGSCKLNNQGGSITLTVPGAVSYTGTPYQASVDNQLKPDIRPTLAYLDAQGQTLTDHPKDAGSYTAKLIVNGISVSDSFTIAPYQLTDGSMTLQDSAFTYDGTEKAPTVTVTANEQTLVAGTDYTVSYQNNIAAGQATVTVTGVGNYAGTVQKQFSIGKAALTQVSVVQAGKLIYNGQAQAASVDATVIALGGEIASIAYSAEENGSYGEMPGFTDAGSYTVYCLLTAPNHESVKTSFTVTIDKAENSWVTQPAIEGWTYGEEAKAPLGQARFGTAQITYTGTANDGTAYSAATAPTRAGSYTVTFTVADTDNYSGITAEAAFTVAKATYDLTGAKWDYTAAFQYDAKEKTVLVTGLPEGITAAGYEGNTATVVGDYTAKVTLTYDQDNYETPVIPELSWRIENTWEPSEFTVTAPNENGWHNAPVILTPHQGYLVSQGNTLEAECLEEMIFTAEGKDLPISFYLWDQATGAISLEKALSYSLDQTVPTGKVAFLERTGWESFLSTITFGLFYKEQVKLQVEAADSLSGVDKIEYASAGQALTLEQVQALESWTEYTESFGIPVEDAKQFVYFVRITDKAGNVTYLSTDGAEYDTSAPVLSGVEDGKTYYVTQTVTVTDRNLSSVTLNGETVTGSVTLEGNREATYILAATDKAGNTTTFTVKMLPIDRLTQPMEKLTEKNVTSDQEKTVRSVKTTLEEQLKSTTLTSEEKTQLEKGKAQAQKLLKVIERTAAAKKQAESEKKKYSPDTVTSDHTQALKDLAEDVQELLDTNNLTKSERAGLEAMAQDIQALQQVIEKTAEEMKQVQAQLEKLAPETVTSQDAAAIEQALAKAEDLLEGQNLTQQEREDLEQTREAAEKLLQTIDKAEQAANTESAQAAQDIHADHVKPDQQTTLEAAKTDLEKALAENSGNYTDEEKQIIRDTLDRIEKALDSLERIGQTEALLTALPGTADRKTQEETQAALTAAEAAYETLTDHERSQLSGQATGQLEATRQALEALARAQKTTKTVLWIAIPGAAVILLIVLLLGKRKKKEK